MEKSHMEKATATEENVPSYEYAAASVPLYEASSSGSQSGAGLTLTIDPTGLFIKSLPSSDAPPLYTFSQTLLKVNDSTSIHIKRPGCESVYAIAVHFISPLPPLSPARRAFANVTAARSHGALVTLGARQIVWDFSTRIPAPKGEARERTAPVDPVYMIGTSGGAGTVQNHLLQSLHGEWLGENDEVVALEREGGKDSESHGMPVLSVVKELDQEFLDFLVAAWCVTLWGQLGKRARKLSHESGKERKFSLFGKA